MLTDMFLISPTSFFFFFSAFALTYFQVVSLSALLFLPIGELCAFSHSLKQRLTGPTRYDSSHAKAPVPPLYADNALTNAHSGFLEHSKL